MGSKSVSAHKGLLADLAYRAVKAVAERRETGWTVSDDDIQMVKKPGGDMSDSALIEGVIVDKERVHPGMPLRVENARIALLNAALEVKKTEVSAEIRIRDPAQMQAFLNEEANLLKTYVDAVERSLEDALSVVAVAVEDGRYLTGGGFAEMELAQGLKEVAPSVGGREQLAVEAFANAMEVIPRTIAQNAGMDPIDTLIEL